MTLFWAIFTYPPSLVASCDTFEFHPSLPSDAPPVQDRKNQMFYMFSIANQIVYLFSDGDFIKLYPVTNTTQMAKIVGHHLFKM